MNMKSFLFSFFYCFNFSLGLFAQYDRPNDFYVAKSGDTTFGTYIYGIKYDGFKNLKGEKIKLRPDSIQSYSIYLENTYRKKSEPYYYTRDWINIEDKFYEVFYRDSGVLSIVFSSPPPTPTLGYLGYSGSNVYYFSKKGILTRFDPAVFYTAAKKNLADCPSMLDMLDNVPNDKNKGKTHKATFSDAAFIISKYNQCVKH